MNVRELIAELQKMNPDLPVYTWDGGVQGVTECEANAGYNTQARRYETYKAVCIQN